MAVKLIDKLQTIDDLLALPDDGELDGYDVLPGFKLRLSELFQVLEG